MTTLHNELSRALRALHRELLETARREYESLYGRVDNPRVLLELVEQEPIFAWLKPLTSALAELDAAIDDRDEPARLPNALERAKELVNGGDPKFAALYHHYLQTEPGVVFAHG